MNMNNETQPEYVVRYSDRSIRQCQTNDWADLCRLLIASMQHGFGFELFVDGVRVSR